MRDYVCGDRFTAADVYVGSQIMFPMQFGMLPERDSFIRYRERLQARDAYKRGNQIDDDSHRADARQPSRSRPAAAQKKGPADRSAGPFDFSSAPASSGGCP